MVEFALVLPLVLVVLVGVVEVALVARTQLEVTQAAREGAREAATSPDPARAVAATKAALDPAAAERATVSVRREHRVGGIAEVSVEVRHRVAAGIGGFDFVLRSRARMRVER